MMDEVPESTLEVEIDATGPHTARDSFEAWAGQRREFSLLEAIEAYDTIPYRTLARWASELKGWRKSRKGREVLFKQRL